MRDQPMKVTALASRTFLERIFDDSLGYFEDSAIFALIFVDRHWFSGLNPSLRRHIRLTD
jgi:hypothetical protein